MPAPGRFRWVSHWHTNVTSAVNDATGHWHHSAAMLSTSTICIWSYKTRKVSVSDASETEFLRCFLFSFFEVITMTTSYILCPNYILSPFCSAKLRRWDCWPPNHPAFQGFSVDMFAFSPCWHLNCCFAVNENYLSSCQSPQHFYFTSFPVALSPPVHPAIAPDATWWNGGWRRLFLLSAFSGGPNCWSLTQTDRAAISLADHTMLQQTAKQLRGRLQTPQFNTPLPPSPSSTTTLKGFN